MSFLHLAIDAPYENSFWLTEYSRKSNPITAWSVYNIDGLVQDCSNSSVLAMELLQSCT